MPSFWEKTKINDVEAVSDEFAQSNKLIQAQHRIAESQFGAHSYADKAADIVAGVDDDAKPNTGSVSLEDRAMALAAKMSKGKNLNAGDLSKLLLMQILIRLKDNPLVDDKKVDELADDKFIEKGSETLRNSKAFVNLQDKPIPSDYKFLKDGKAYDALAAEQKKILDEEKITLEKQKKIEEREAKKSLEMNKGILGIDPNSRVGQEMLTFNKLDTPEQKKKRLEELFGVKDLSKMNPEEMKKAGQIKEFLKDANEIKQKEIQFEKQPDQPEELQKKNENLQLGRRYL